MAFDKKGLDDYVDVATRITEFRAKYPDGYLAPIPAERPYQIVNIGLDDKVFIVVVAAAYRQPGDLSPGVGMAWEPFPGRTPYTKDSELMNAETSAWGRAIIALGAADSRKGIASREEVRNRQDEPSPFEAEADAARGGDWRPPANPHTRKADRTRGPLPDDQWTGTPANEDSPGTSNLDQQRRIAIRLGERGLTSRADKLAFCMEAGETGRPITSSKDLSFNEAAKILKITEAA
jgi:hypothetical protein